MAEFVEVIKNVKRLCENRGFVNCKLGCPLSRQKNGRNTDCIPFRENYPEEYEAIVMKWAEEHPAQTNRQKLAEILEKTFGKYVAESLTTSERRNCFGFSCNGRTCDNCEDNDFWEKEYKEQTK